MRVRAIEAGGGNDGLWKAWENDKTVFPPFPQPLEIAVAITTFPPPRRLRGSMDISNNRPLRSTHPEGKVNRCTCSTFWQHTCSC